MTQTHRYLGNKLNTRTSTAFKGGSRNSSYERKTRQKSTKTRSLHAVNEHFEEFFVVFFAVDWISRGTLNGRTAYVLNTPHIKNRQAHPTQTTQHDGLYQNQSTLNKHCRSHTHPPQENNYPPDLIPTHTYVPRLVHGIDPLSAANTDTNPKI